MAEQQLVDYIKKAREAGQSDGQTRSLLYKNGWTQAEVDDAIFAIDPKNLQPTAQSPAQPEVGIQVKGQPENQAIQPKIENSSQAQLKPQITEQPEVSAQRSDYQSLQTAAQANYQANQEKRPKRNVVLNIFLVFLSLIIVVGVGYFILSQYLKIPSIFSSIDFSTLPFVNEKPEKVIVEMVKNVNAAKTYRSTANFDIALNKNDTKTSQYKIILNLDSRVDLSDSKNEKILTNSTINFTDNSSGAPINSKAKVNAINANNALYFNIGELNLPSNSSSQIEFSKIIENIGQWFKMDEESVNILSNQAGMLINANNKGMKNLITFSENLFSFDKKLNDEEIAGQKTYHYSLIVNKEKLKEIFKKIIENFNEGATNEEIAAINLFTGLINNAINDAGDIKADVWIGKKDKMLYQLKLNKNINLEKYFNLPFTIDAKIQQTFSDFNNAVIIQLPENTQKIENFLLPVIKLMNIRDDLQEISLIAAKIIDVKKNYYDLCNRGLLNGYLPNDGKTLVELHTDIVENSGKKPVCFAGYQNYCVSVEISDGNYLCIGKEGVVGSGKCLSALTICK